MAAIALLLLKTAFDWPLTSTDGWRWWCMRVGTLGQIWRSPDIPYLKVTVLRISQSCTCSPDVFAGALLLLGLSVGLQILLNSDDLVVVSMALGSDCFIGWFNQINCEHRRCFMVQMWMDRSFHYLSLLNSILKKVIIKSSCNRSRQLSYNLQMNYYGINQVR